MKDINIENYKTQIEEIKVNANKWKDIILMD